MYVCDRCGMPAGTCHHAAYEDYVTQPAEQYDFERYMVSIGTLGAAVIALALLIWVGVVK